MFRDQHGPVEHLFTLADDQAVAGELLATEGCVDGIHLLVPHGDAALLHQPPGLALAGAQAAPDQQVQHVDLAAAQVVAKGADLERMFAELMARENGYCKGKGGSMHIADLSIGMLGANGIVGGGIPIAVGAAFALKYQERSDVVVCFFGDGASNEGSFHESLNMASVLKLPVIFVCENNQYAISMNVKDSVNVPNISQRSTAYGIPGYTLDGNDIEQVYTEFGKIVADVRQGKGPVLVEMKTYRLGGHYYGDNENYRTREEVAEWRAKCPITRLEARLVSEYGCTHEELAEIAKSAKAEVLAASERAKSGPSLGWRTWRTICSIPPTRRSNGKCL